MKVGDLVRVTDDPQNRCGLGIVFDMKGNRHAKVHWFDELLNADCIDDWLNMRFLKVVNESR